MPGLLFESNTEILMERVTLGGAAHNLYQLSPHLYGMWTKGRASTLYWEGMRYAEESNNSVAFIGVDCKSAFPTDIYHLSVLTGQQEVQTGIFLHYFERLVHVFFQAARQINFTTEELGRMANVCCLGQDTAMSREHSCSMYLKARELSEPEFKQQLQCMNMHDYRERNNTRIRFMAHICYLHTQTKPDGLFEKLFQPATDASRESASVTEFRNLYRLTTGIQFTGDIPERVHFMSVEEVRREFPGIMTTLL